MAYTRCGAALIEQYNSNQPLAQLKIDNCDFINNKALHVGVLRVGNISGFILSNSKFIGNSVTQYTAACTFAQYSSGSVNNSLFANNIAGGGTSGGAGVSNFSNVDFMNCTFSNNISGSGGGIQLRQGGIAFVTNCIFWGNQPNQISLQAVNDTSACTLLANYNDIQYGVDSINVNDTISVINWGVGNIFSDPLFVDAINRDYHLKDSSPCIGTGIGSKKIDGTWFYCPSTDIEGNTRPNPKGTMPDMGAYESQYIVQVEDNNLNIPTKYALYQNYPNPFNPTTKVKYTVASLNSSQEGTLVLLKIYDVLGREVAALVNEEKPAGNYELNWNAASLPSGVYFYQLKAGSYVETKKMLLLK